MTSRQLDEEAIFHTARKIPDPEARSDYLDQICGDDTALLRRVEALLEVHEQEQEFLKSAAGAGCDRGHASDHRGSRAPDRSLQADGADR